MNYFTRYLASCLLLLLLAAFVTHLGGEDIETLVCSECRYENDVANEFCVHCGKSLAEEYADWQGEAQERQRHSKRFISELVDPSRLYSVPTARVLGSLDISLMGGGAFGAATDRSFLGTIGVGLGNIAEVEFSTVGLVTNITRGSTVFPTSAFKLMLISGKRWYVPSLAIAFRSSSNWQGVHSDRDVLKAEGLWEGAVSADEQVSNIGYSTRFTTMHGVSTLRWGPVSLHGGASLTDVRVKDLSVDFYHTSSHVDSVEKQKNLFGVFFGFDIESNPQTKLMFEARTVSNYRYNPGTKRIDVSEALLAVGGVRFFFSRWLSTDVGVWYQSTFRGIADMQIKMGLNLFVPMESIGRKARLSRAGQNNSDG